MERLKKYAPGLPTMLTEQPEEALAGPIDIWCPITPDYDHAEAPKQRRAHGERFWWYVCCGPKAPYCTLFIDHPATDLRVWLWQTWQRKIVGVLVWESTYWTSRGRPGPEPLRGPDGLRGRLAARGAAATGATATGGSSIRRWRPPRRASRASEPVIEPPVSSIRWEMLREGIEDYEFLWLLRDLIAKKRSSLPAEQAEGLRVALGSARRDHPQHDHVYDRSRRRSTPAGRPSPRRSSSWRNRRSALRHRVRR